MRKGTKSDLYSIFPTSVKEARDKDDIYVVDGGLILHKLVCSIRKKFKELCAEHVRYVKHHYGDHCHIVFDGYQEVGLKYNEHARRYKKSAPDTVITEDTPLTDSQSLFLANVTNKSRFIDMLSKIFKEADIHTTVAQGDADRPIVVTAINLADADETRKVFVIGEDTDLLVLLAGLPSSSQELFFHKPGRNGVASRQSRNIAELKKNNFLPDTVLFIHAFTGCDVISAVFGKGKESLWHLVQNTSELRAAICNFYLANATHENIFKLGCTLFRILYGAPETVTSINEYRFSTFKVATLKHTANLKSLCPTEGAARQHAYRVYAQVQTWLGNNPVMTDWGWKRNETDTFCTPAPINDPPAPETVLKSLFCACRKGCANGCGCRKLGNGL